MVASDVATGVLLVIFGTLTLSQRFDLARWGLGFSGIWLLFAPLGLFRGFILRNSDVGAAALTLDVFLY